MTAQLSLSAGLERIDESQDRRPRGECLLLALMWCPSRQEEQIQRHLKSAASVRELACAYLEPSTENRPDDRPSGSLAKAVRFPETAQFGNGCERVGIGQMKAVDIGDRQAESRSLQKGARIAYVDRRKRPRSDARRHCDLCLNERKTQFRQGFASGKYGDHEPIRRKHPAYLHEGARQVLDGMMFHHAENEIERGIAKRKE